MDDVEAARNVKIFVPFEMAILASHVLAGWVLALSGLKFGWWNLGDCILIAAAFTTVGALLMIALMIYRFISYMLLLMTLAAVVGQMRNLMEGLVGKPR